jgi:hypothetical protein
VKRAASVSRTILFAFALIAQSVVGGFGALAAPAAGNSPSYEHCSTLAPSKGEPTQHQRHQQSCLHCQCCLGGLSPVPTYYAAYELTLLRLASGLSYWPALVSEPLSRVGQGNRARAPPALS